MSAALCVRIENVCEKILSVLFIFIAIQLKRRVKDVRAHMPQYDFCIRFTSQFFNLAAWRD